MNSIAYGPLFKVEETCYHREKEYYKHQKGTNGQEGGGPGGRQVQDVATQGSERRKEKCQGREGGLQQRDGAR